MSAPRREEIIGDARLILGDCRELIGQVPADAAIVSDPPYGIALDHTGSGGGIWKRRHAGMIAGDDEPFQPGAWLGFRDALLWGANHYADRLPPSGGWLIWDKKLGLKVDSFSDGEAAWHMRGNRLMIFRKLWNGLLAHEPGERRHHRHQKPIDLMRWCLGFVDAETICDPFLGSGTTAIAAMREGRRFIGVEIDPTHFATACRRIEAAHRQADLFVERQAPRPEQANLALGDAA